MRCPHCSAQLESPLACTACGRILAALPEPTPFEIFDLPVAVAVDQRELRRRLLRLSRAMHPDFFATATPAEREIAERNSALLNAAHETLADEVRRADWIVEHLGGPDENVERQMPQAFLIEVLEWNEALEDVRAAASGADVERTLARLEDTLRARRTMTIAAIERSLTPLPARNAPQLRDARRELNAVRYFDRALREIEALRLSKASAR